ncbi:MAG: InlB B-repeat-containing protein, partial [Propionibacteriaceae bacterium]|nr:InlB B-repeat-containing protein [Propionibacteriaceae bacterium]
KPFSRLLAALSSLALVIALAGQSALLIPQAQASPLTDRTLLMTVKVSDSPPAITLEWVGKDYPYGTFMVYRKAKNSTAPWGFRLAMLPGTATSYTDTDVQVGQVYEYKVENPNISNYMAFALAGVKVPAVESRGTAVVLVEAEVADALQTELNTFKMDLIADGWSVIRHDVSRNSTPEAARALVQADYKADPTNVQAVVLLGHIPIIKTGHSSPDGHTARAFAADAYYGSMGQFTVDSSSILNDIELQVGRVDFFNMPAFSKNATELLRQYLNKDHKYKTGQLPTTRDGLISDGFGVTSITNSSNRNAERLFPVLWGDDARVDRGSWATYLPKETYTWGHLSGYGSCSSVAAAGGTMTTARLATSNYGMIFGQSYGSYFGDWDCTNNVMRAFLGMPEYGLTWSYVMTAFWHYHHMGIGETVGYSTRATQNSFQNGYSLYGGYPPSVNTNLMGDPTLRMYPVLPVTNLSARIVSGSSTVTWTASDEPGVESYYVYGAAKEDGPYTRLGITSSTSYTYNNSGSITHFMVRASKLTTTGSGSFYNLSLGEIVKATTLAPGTFTLTYDAAENGGATTAQAAEVFNGTLASLTPTATKTGWTFLGWNTNKDATTALASYTMPSADATLYAIYSKTLTVTLKDFNQTAAATRTVPVTIYNKATSGSATLPSVNTYTGWTSRGWSTAITGNSSVTVTSGAYTVSADSTLYGVYQRTLTLTYDPDGGTPTPAAWTGIQYTNSYNISATVNPSMTLAPEITKKGFVFDGWVSSASGAKHAAGATVAPYTDTTMKASWTHESVAQFTLTYNAAQNGGTTTAATVQLTAGAAVPLTPTATKSGWTFVGWNTNKDATTALTSLTMGTSNTTVYAIFSKTLTVTLKDYNGTAAATRTASVRIYNTATSGDVTIPAVN